MLTLNRFWGPRARPILRARCGLIQLARRHDFYAALTSKILRLCPQCGIGTMVRIQILGPGQAPLAIRMDSS